MMWEVMYAVSMFYCHWLIKKVLSANGLTEKSQDERDIQRQQAESGRCHVAAVGGDGCWNLAGKPQPGGDAQIKRNGLI